MGLVADTSNRIADGLTIRDMSGALRLCNVPQEDCVRLETLLDRIESAQYGASDASDTTTIIKEATELVKRVSPFLERGRQTMIRILNLLFGMLLVCVLSSRLSADQESDRQRDFLRSLELFDKAQTPEDFRESAKVLEALLTDGYRNGAVYYNLGNAYFRAGDFGRAILSYRKAKPYRPSDPLLEANLQQALASAPGRIAIPPKPWWSPVMFWTESLAYPSRVWIAILSSGLAPFLVFASVLLRRRNIVWFAVGLTILGIVFAIDGYMNSPERNSNRLAVITGETIARKGIGKDYEPAFSAPLKDGAEFVVISETNGWTFGRFAEIGDGWVKNDFVAR